MFFSNLNYIFVYLLSCATDTELFPQFSSISQGVLSAAFGAFRTTDLNGGSVSMTFSCTLQVCLGSCVPVRIQYNSKRFSGMYRLTRCFNLFLNPSQNSWNICHSFQIPIHSPPFKHVYISLPIFKIYSFPLSLSLSLSCHGLHRCIYRSKSERRMLPMFRCIVYQDKM